MYNLTLVALIIAIAMSTGVKAAENKHAVKIDKGNITSYHEPAQIDGKNAFMYGMDNTIKTKKLDNYPSATIGEAIDSYGYFETRDWKVTQLPNTKIYVDFTGMFKNGIFNLFTMEKGVSRQGVEIKFVVYENGRFGVAMISKVNVMTDGMIKRYPLGDTKSILDKIYAKKEIKF